MKDLQSSTILQSSTVEEKTYKYHNGKRLTAEFYGEKRRKQFHNGKRLTTSTNISQVGRNTAKQRATGSFAIANSGQVGRNTPQQGDTTLVRASRVRAEESASRCSRICLCMCLCRYMCMHVCE